MAPTVIPASNATKNQVQRGIRRKLDARQDEDQGPSDSQQPDTQESADEIEPTRQLAPSPPQMEEVGEVNHRDYTVGEPNQHSREYHESDSALGSGHGADFSRQGLRYWRVRALPFANEGRREEFR